MRGNSVPCRYGSCETPDEIISFVSMEAAPRGAALWRTQLPDKLGRSAGLEGPVVAAHLFEIAFCLPAEKLAGAGRVGERSGNVAGSPGDDFVGNVVTTGPGKSGDYLKDRVPATGPEIDMAVQAISLVGIEKMPNCRNMPTRQIHHVDVVANAGTV